MTVPYSDPTGGFDSFDQFIVEVAKAGVSHGSRHPSLRWSSAAGANEAMPSEGGFTVPHEYSLALIEGVEGFATLYPETDRQPIMKGNVLKLPVFDERSRVTGSRFGGIRLYRPDEAQQVPESTPKYRSVSLLLNKLMGVSGATSELFEDVPALRTILERCFRMEAGTCVDDEIIDGSGVGQMLGILRSDALITVAPESGQPAASVRAGNVTSMWSRCWAPGQRRALWLHNSELTGQLFALADDGLVTFGEDGPRMLGRPLVAHESAKAPGNVGDLMLVVPDQYVIGEKPAEFAESLHLRFIAHEACFRFSWRLAGSPGWASPLTPLHGTNVVSPFIALGAR